MRRGAAFIIAIILASGAPAARMQEAPAVAGVVRFEAVDVFADSGAAPLAAWQLDFAAATGGIRIVGIEGGEPGVFADPPYYDPAAMRSERVVIAAFSTAAPQDLPRGRSRIATVHVEISGGQDPQYVARLVVSGGPDGAPIPVTIQVQKGQR